MAKPKATKNKAGDVETKTNTEKLWAEYGKLSAQRENALLFAQQTAQKMNEVMRKINKK